MFSLEKLPGKQFTVPEELLPAFRLSQKHPKFPNALTEAIFTCEAFWDIFKYFLNESFSSIDEYKTFSEKILQEMREIADHLDEVARDVGISKIVGGVAGVAGGVLCIVGIALAPFTLGASAIVSAVGISVGLAGGLTSTGAAIAEAVYDKTDKDKFREKFEKFRSASEILHAFAWEFVKKSDEADLFNKTEAGKAFLKLSVKPGAFLHDDNKRNPGNIQTGVKVAFQFGSHIRNTINAIGAITKAHNLRMGIGLVGMTDEAINLGTPFSRRCRGP